MKQGISKTRDMVLYLVFEYMDTDLKKFIRSFRQTRENIHLPTVKVSSIRLVFLHGFYLKCFSDWFFGGFEFFCFLIEMFSDCFFLIIDVDLDV